MLVIFAHDDFLLFASLMREIKRHINVNVGDRAYMCVCAWCTLTHCVFSVPVAVGTHKSLPPHCLGEQCKHSATRAE